MLRDKIAEHEKLMSYAETSVSKEMIIDNYKLSRRVAQTIKSRLQDSGASLRDAGPTCLLSGNISIEDEGHMLGTIQYSLSPLYAALLLGDDEAAKDFYEQGADIMGNQNSISYNVNNAFQTHSMFLQEIWAALLYRSWIGDCSGMIYELLEDRYQKAARTEKSMILESIVVYISSQKPFTVKYAIGEKFMEECPSILEGLIRTKQKVCMAIDNLPCNVLEKMLDQENSGIYAMCLHRETKSWPVHEFRKPGLDSVETAGFMQNVWKNDRITEAVEKAYAYEYGTSEQIEKERLKRFYKSFERISKLLDERMYLKIIFDMWDIKQCGNDLKYVTILQELIKRLDDGTGRLKQIYADDILPFCRGNIKQFFFFKNEIAPEGVIDIDIVKLNKLNVPAVDTDSYSMIGSSAFDMIEEINEKQNRYLRKIWKESHFIIKKEKNLYAYQKKIIRECEEDDIIAAQKCGLLPGKVMESAIKYARENNCIKALPILIWFESKEA